MNERIFPGRFRITEKMGYAPNTKNTTDRDIHGYFGRRGSNSITARDDNDMNNNAADPMTK